MSEYSLYGGGGAAPPPPPPPGGGGVQWVEASYGAPGAYGGGGPMPAPAPPHAYGGGYGGGPGPPPHAMGGSVGGSGRPNFDDEPPLLEELGIDLPSILRKSAAVLTCRPRAAGAEAPDLGGPLLFAAALGAVHLLTSKLHFGVILGWTVAGSAAVWAVAAALASAAAADGGGGGGGGAASAGPGVGLYDTTCQVGYGLLPLVVSSAAALLLPRAPGGGAGGAARALVCGGAGWGALSAAALVSARAPSLRPHAALIAYPCGLLYGALALLTLYHRGGGGGAGGGGR